MASFNLSVNGENYTVDADPDMPLLWVLRDLLGLTGTKFGCGVASCGACTVLLDGQAQRSCVLQVKNAVGMPITSIEGLSKQGDHPIQQAWETVGVPQCGYCQAGQIMTLAGLLNSDKNPSPETLRLTMSQVLCRCGTYQRIRQAAELAIKTINS